MASRETRVIGYFAYVSQTLLLCTDVDACIVSGSREAMEGYLSEKAPQGAAKGTIRKTRFGDILRGLNLGAAYAFDRESYGRFRPLALEVGVPVEDVDFAAHQNKGRFITVRLVDR